MNPLIYIFVTLALVWLALKAFGEIYLMVLRKGSTEAEFVKIHFHGEDPYNGRPGYGPLEFISVGKTSNPFSTAAEADYSDVCLFPWDATKTANLPFVGKVIEYDHKLIEAGKEPTDYKKLAKLALEKHAPNGKLVLVHKKDYIEVFTVQTRS